eukprot:CAMPEP_0180578042 /NCGR_PEP_ID=MMETSP1037_2-20121125/12253_1 /TAXON_ID=632150 /ORGANISM="Azadinium spinosum, Strain 3D9" /LENGTH=511 /DNA_ID=CAMNT_0022595823 /DNA_START=134 /DNA_END=1666 /DNA_ORIENTATION=+
MAPRTKRRMTWQPAVKASNSGFSSEACTQVLAPRPTEELGTLHADGNSTEATDDSLSGIDESDSGSSDHGGCGRALEVLSHSSSTASISPLPCALYARDVLLRARPPVGSGQAPEGCHIFTAPRPALATSAAPTPPISPAMTPKSPSQQQVSPGASAKGLLPPGSPNSWATAQKLRRAAQATSDTGASDAEVGRAIKSILNKLTPEKFDTLYAKLIQCGISSWAHVELLAQAIVREAMQQHSFSSMYADLCTYLIVELGQGGLALIDGLLAKCWQLFEESLSPPPPAAVDDEAAQEAQALHKKHMLGNTRFMGELFIRNILLPPGLFACTSAFLELPLAPARLENLAMLLTTVGPFFDNPMWSHFSQLRSVFWHIRGLTFDPTVPTRVRFLLRDVLDLRDAGWVDTKNATRSEKPKQLEQVRHEAAQEARAGGSHHDGKGGKGAIAKAFASWPNSPSSPVVLFSPGMFPCEAADLLQSGPLLPPAAAAEEATVAGVAAAKLQRAGSGSDHW